MARMLKLTKDRVTIVDEDDWDYLSQWHWCFDGKYAARYPRVNGKSHKILMHRLILKTPDGMQTDHINHDKLDNRKCNLRVCNNSQNQSNGIQYKNKIRGINKVGNKWRARIVHNGKLIHLGYYDNPKDAEDTYKRKSEELFGEFAYCGEAKEALKQLEE